MNIKVAAFTLSEKSIKSTISYTGTKSYAFQMIKAVELKLMNERAYSIRYLHVFFLFLA